MQDKLDHPLVDTVGECSMSLFNMVIFGVATPYLHNGNLSVENDNGEVSVKKQLLYGQWLWLSWKAGHF